jgi:hypothetical protein
MLKFQIPVFLAYVIAFLSRSPYPKSIPFHSCKKSTITFAIRITTNIPIDLHLVGGGSWSYNFIDIVLIVYAPA